MLKKWYDANVKRWRDTDGEFTKKEQEAPQASLFDDFHKECNLVLYRRREEEKRQQARNEFILKLLDKVQARTKSVVFRLKDNKLTILVGKEDDFMSFIIDTRMSCSLYSIHRELKNSIIEQYKQKLTITSTYLNNALNDNLRALKEIK